jgi:recombination protein RecT
MGNNQEIQVTNVYDIVKAQEATFNSVLFSDTVLWEKESQFAIQALQANDYLNKIAWNNRESLQNSIINVASIGISLNPAQKHAYLVPRDSKVCLDISYMGLLHLAMKTGSILWGQAKLVYANDKYENTGIDSAPIHVQQTFGEKGAIVGVYCTVKTAEGAYLTEEMDIEALDKVKATSKAAKGPWKTWPEEMMRKTVVKRGSKYWPDRERLSSAVDVLNEHEGLTETEKEVYGPKLISEEQKGELLALINGNDSVFELAATHCKEILNGIDGIPISEFDKIKKVMGRAARAIEIKESIEYLMACDIDQFFESWNILSKTQQNAIWGKMTHEQQEKINPYFGETE